MTTRSLSYTSPIAGPPPGLPTDTEILGRASGENFAVASRFLPSRARQHLLAFYGFARLVDQLGDAYAGDRMSALDWLEGETRAALAAPVAETGADARLSAGGHRLVADAAHSVRALGIDPAPLFDLIEANRQDQTIASYATFAELHRYCRLSADPVGRLVLGAFGRSDERRIALSDALCTGLQLVEHWQDVVEDARSGRVYLPQEDLRRFGVDPRRLEELGPAPAEVRALMVFEVARAREWLDRGRPLVGLLAGRYRVAVAGFWAGGHAALDAIADRDFDVLVPAVRPRPHRVLRHTLAALLPAPEGGR